MTEASGVFLGELLASVAPGFASGEKSPSGVLQIRMNNVTTEGGWDWNAARRVPAADKVVAKYLVREGDVLFNSTNSPNLVGKTAVFRDIGEPVLFSNHFLRIRPKADRLDGAYLARWINAMWQRRLFETRCTQWVNQASFRKEDLLQLRIPLPPLAEQRRIAATLDKIDSIRQRRRLTTDLTELLIRAAFHRLVGSANRAYGDWPVCRVADVAARQPGAMRTGPFGSALRHSEFVDEGVAVLGIDNAVANRFEWAERRFITEAKYQGLRRYRVYSGDVIVTLMGTIGRSAVVPEDIPLAISTKHLATITVNPEKVHPEFLSNAIHRAPELQRQIRARDRGSIMAGLNLEVIKQLQVRLPPLDLQEQFASALRRVRAVRQHLQTSIEQMDQLQGSLSWRLFQNGVP